MLEHYWNALPQKKDKNEKGNIKTERDVGYRSNYD